MSFRHCRVAKQANTSNQERESASLVVICNFSLIQKSAVARNFAFYGRKGSRCRLFEMKFDFSGSPFFFRRGPLAWIRMLRQKSGLAAQVMTFERLECYKVSENLTRCECQRNEFREHPILQSELRASCVRGKR